MSIFIAAVLIVGGLIAAAVFVIGVPALLGVMAFDSVKAAKSAPARSAAAEEHASWLRSKESLESRISVKRNVARAFVILGGTFWAIAVFAGLYSYRQTGLAWALLGALIPFTATMATLILGWYYERITASLLLIASAGVVYWGVANGFELGVWSLVTIALIGPMATAASLFWMARRQQEELEIVLAARPELVPAVATSRS